MLLQKEERSALNTVTRYGNNYIDVNDVRYDHAICFKPEGPITAWPVKTAADITTEMLELAAGITRKQANPLDFLNDASAPSYENPPDVLLIG
ncbi:MAG: hypothetical protein GX070_10805, partial [Alcaligenaceae bacterium]|nr:hypothetical protein [Alcaligenaceae bacterium]